MPWLILSALGYYLVLTYCYKSSWEKWLYLSFVILCLFSRQKINEYIVFLACLLPIYLLWILLECRYPSIPRLKNYLGISVIITTLKPIIEALNVLGLNS